MVSGLRTPRRLAVDGRALSIGVGATAASTLSMGLIATIVDRAAGLAPRSNWTFLLGLLVLGGWMAGGFVAGAAGRSAPATHAVLASAVVWVGWQVVATARDASGGWTTVLVNGLLAVGAGLLGGLLSLRRQP